MRLSKQQILNMNNGQGWEQEVYHKGGGSTTTTKKDPRLENAAAGILESGLAAGNAGKLSQVAGQSQLQDVLLGTSGGGKGGSGKPGAIMETFNQANQDAAGLREQAQGSFGDSAAFGEAQQALGLSNFGNNSTGGRSRLAQGAIGADASAKFQDRQNNLRSQALQTQTGALQGLSQGGQLQRGIKQEQLDSENKKYAALGQLLGGTAGGFGTTQETTSGGK